MARERRLLDFQSRKPSRRGAALDDADARILQDDGAADRPVRCQPYFLVARAAVVRCAAVSRLDRRNAGERDAAGAASGRIPAQRFAEWREYHKARTGAFRSEEHTSELQSLMRTTYAVFCMKKNNKIN